MQPQGDREPFFACHLLVTLDLQLRRFLGTHACYYLDFARLSDSRQLPSLNGKVGKGSAGVVGLSHIRRDGATTDKQVPVVCLSANLPTPLAGPEASSQGRSLTSGCT
jgi:hypothetical protein